MRMDGESRNDLERHSDNRRNDPDLYLHGRDRPPVRRRREETDKVDKTIFVAIFIMSASHSEVIQSEWSWPESIIA
jgi:hypothetical protein